MGGDTVRGSLSLGSGLVSAAGAESEKCEQSGGAEGCEVSQYGKTPGKTSALKERDVEPAETWSRLRKQKGLEDRPRNSPEVGMGGCLYLYLLVVVH